MKQYVGSCYVELWQRDKLIVRFKGKEPPNHRREDGDPPQYVGTEFPGA